MKRFVFGFLVLLLTGCAQLSDRPPQPSQGGSIIATHKGSQIEIVQPENPEMPAYVEFQYPDGTRVRADTGSSRPNRMEQWKVKLAQYEVFVYVGAGVCVLGIGLTVASFWVPLIPKLAGPMIFAGGALTAFMSTAIPDYGPYFLVVSLLGAIAWFYHYNAARKDPSEFEVRKK